MYYLIKVYSKNDVLLLESDKIYQYDLNKFIEFSKFIKTEMKIVINNYNNDDVSEQDENNLNLDISNNLRFSDMTIEKYGKGYILECADDHPDYGIKYYHNAWWFNKLNCWFFKKEYLDYFIENGATIK